MISTADPTGSFLRTCTTLFQHPIFHNPGWREVQALLRQLGDIHDGRPAGRTSHRLLVIDHQEARLLRMELKDGSPERLLAHGPDKYFRHAHNSPGFSRGEEKPDPNSFPGPVAQELQGSGEILVFGTGAGKSHGMDPFVAWVKVHHPERSKRIIGTVVVDDHHPTDAQLLATARACHENHTGK
ncbi:MAG TPA: hypothetical protein VIO38_07010 [Rariglobus sp.]